MDGRNDQAALTDQWGAIISYSDTEPNIGADDMGFNIILVIGLYLAMIWPELCRSTNHTKGWLPCVGSMIHPFVGGRFLLWWKLLQSPFTFGLP